MGWVGGIGVSFRGVRTTTHPRHVCVLTRFTDEETGWMWVTCRDLFATLKEQGLSPWAWRVGLVSGLELGGGGQRGGSEGWV